MTEQEKKQSIVEENLNVAVDEVAKTAESAATLGRKVTALWLGVTRTAIDAAANTLLKHLVSAYCAAEHIRRFAQCSNKRNRQCRARANSNFFARFLINE